MLLFPRCNGLGWCPLETHTVRGSGAVRKSLKVGQKARHSREQLRALPRLLRLTDGQRQPTVWLIILLQTVGSFGG
jgi:hypothetical protein